MPLWAPNTFGDPGQDSGDFGPKIGGNHPKMIFFSGTKRYYCSQSFSNRAHATAAQYVVRTYNHPHVHMFCCGRGIYNGPTHLVWLNVKRRNQGDLLDVDILLY